MSRLPNELFYGIGLICMLFAVLLANVTIAGGSYDTVLVTVLLLTTAADGCLTVVAVREREGWRLAAILTMMPTLYVVADVLRRVLRTF